MSTLTHPHVTISKTPLNDNYKMNAIENITSLLYYLLYIGITLPLMLILLSSLLSDLRELRPKRRQEK